MPGPVDTSPAGPEPSTAGVPRNLLQTFWQRKWLVLLGLAIGLGIARSRVGDVPQAALFSGPYQLWVEAPVARRSGVVDDDVAILRTRDSDREAAPIGRLH